MLICDKQLVYECHVVYPERVAGRSDIGSAMTGRELQDEVGRGLVGRSPSRLLDDDALAFAITSIVTITKSHERGVIACHVSDVAIVDGVGGVVHPSIGALAVLHHHGAHTLGRDVAVGILVTLLQIEDCLLYTSPSPRDTR